MGEGRRRTARRACLVAAGLCVTLAVAAPAFAQDEGPARPEVWRGAASADAISVSVDRDGLLPVADALRFSVAQGTSVYETDNQTARASLLYAGEGALQGPNLLCGTFLAPNVPPEMAPIVDACLSYRYPLTVTADASTSDVSTDGSVALGKASDPVSADAVGARAHAAPDGSFTRAQLGDLRVLGLPAVDLVSLLPLDGLATDASVARVGSVRSVTDQRFEGGRLVVEATTELSGVDLVGGLVSIEAITSTSVATDDGAGRRTASAKVSIGGVTVAGLPAAITEDGLVVGSPSGMGPVKQRLQQQVNQLLQTLGVRFTLLESTESTDDGTGLARAQAGGLLVEIKAGVAGLPPVPGPLGDIDLNGEYVGSVLLGSSGAAAGAASFEDEGPPAVAPPVAGGTDGSTALGDGGAVAGNDGTVDVPPDEALVPTPTDPTGLPPVLTSVIDTFGGRMGFLYLAFAFTVLGLCLVPRLTLPARLPGPPS